MTTKIIASKSLACAEAIGRREDVTTYGALAARNVVLGGGTYLSAGRLSGSDLDRFRADRQSIVYVVTSYATPIAWVTADGTVYRVAQRFSVTTSAHQSRTYLLG